MGSGPLRSIKKKKCNNESIDYVNFLMFYINLCSIQIIEMDEELLRHKKNYDMEMAFPAKNYFNIYTSLDWISLKIQKRKLFAILRGKLEKMIYNHTSNIKNKNGTTTGDEMKKSLSEEYNKIVSYNQYKTPWRFYINNSEEIYQSFI